MTDYWPHETFHETIMRCGDAAYSKNGNKRKYDCPRFTAGSFHLMDIIKRDGDKVHRYWGGIASSGEIALSTIKHRGDVSAENQKYNRDFDTPCPNARFEKGSDGRWILMGNTHRNGIQFPRPEFYIQKTITQSVGLWVSSTISWLFG